MAIKLFGFKIGKDDSADKLPSFTPPENVEAAIETTSAGGAFAAYVDMEGSAKNEIELIKKYRDMAMYPECDLAIENIIQDAIVTNAEKQVVNIDLSESSLSKNIKNIISEEFDHVLRLLDFQNQGYDIFKRWYVDGRIYYHVVIDPNDVTKGIQQLRNVDSLKIKKVREKDIKKQNRESIIPTYLEYYVYNEKGIFSNNQQSLRIAPDSIVTSNSGITNQNKTMVLSYLHKSIKPLNQLRMLEDAVVIYRISRAPERRIFYVDVGNLPKQKAEQYLRDIMTRYKNKLIYDANSGEVKDDRRHMSMLEDYWMPRREGGRGTEITTLPGGQNLGEMEDVEYFRKKLYQSLGVPLSRLEADTPFQLGRASEINRDEVKFSRFIAKLRNKFSNLFYQILERQLVLKNIISPEEWSEIKDDIKFDYAADSHFAELKEAELLQNRIQVLREIEDYVGKYYSVNFVRKHILHQTDEEIERIDKEIEETNKTNPEQHGYDDEFGVDRMTALQMKGGVPKEQQDGSSQQDDEQ